MADIYGHEQALAQRNAVRDNFAKRQAQHLKNGGRPNMPLVTHPSQAGEEAELLNTMKTIANDESFVNGLGLMPPSDPGFNPSYGHANSGAGYQYGFHQPMVPHGLPPQAISAAPQGQFAGAPMPTHANPAAMDPAGVAAAANTERNDDNDPSRPNDYAAAMAGLEQYMNPRNGNLEYSGKLAEQPWFPQYVQAARMRGGASDDQLANDMRGRLPTIENTGKVVEDPSFKRFGDWYNSDAQLKRRARRDSGIDRMEAIAASPHRQRAMMQAQFRDNPQMATLQALQKIGGQGGGGGIGLPQMAAMAMMGMGDAVPGIMNAQAQMAHNQGLLGIQQGQLDLQRQIAGQNAQQNRAQMIGQLPLGKEGDAMLIRQSGGFSKLPVEEQRAMVTRILAKHKNRLTESEQEFAEVGISEDEAVRAMGGSLPPQQSGWYEWYDHSAEQERRRRHGIN